MSRKKQWQNNNNRKYKGEFCMLPHRLMDDEVYLMLGFSAKCLLLDLLRQSNGRNNGSFSTSWKLLKKRGWKSKDTIDRARKELLRSGLIVMTRQGGLKPMRYSMHALAWIDIGEVDGMDLPWSGMIGKRTGTWKTKK